MCSAPNNACKGCFFFLELKDEFSGLWPTPSFLPSPPRLKIPLVALYTSLVPSEKCHWHPRICCILPACSWASLFAQDLTGSIEKQEFVKIPQNVPSVFLLLKKPKPKQKNSPNSNNKKHTKLQNTPTNKTKKNSLQVFVIFQLGCSLDLSALSTKRQKQIIKQTSFIPQIPNNSDEAFRDNS